MKKKHGEFTPGPWYWSFSIIDPYSLSSPTGDVLKAIDGHVYSEYSSDSATIDISSPANGYLIEAAPDLFIACQKAAGVLSGEDTNKASLVEALEAVRAAMNVAINGRERPIE